MSTAVPRVLAALLLSTLVAPLANAQEGGGVYEFYMTLANPGVDVLVSGADGRSVVTGEVWDNSKPNSLSPGLPVLTPIQHSVTVVATPVVPKAGWTTAVSSIPTFPISPGERKPFEVEVKFNALATEFEFDVNVTATFTGLDGTTIKRSAIIGAITNGRLAFDARGNDAINMAPREIVDKDIILSNKLGTPRTFELAVVDNPCLMGSGLQTTVVLDALEETRLPYTVQAPEDKLLYLFGDQCPFTLQVTPQDRPDQARFVYLTVTVQGTNFTFPFLFNTLLVLLAVILLVLFFRRRKEALEEEILGKPQKPWTIPVEQVYLKHLKAKDERAAYVVRHYLMEDEHRSALLWYKAYKKATRADRKRERLVLSEERAYERWRRREDRKVAKPILLADKLDAKLQRGLDREAAGRHKKAMKRWRRDVAKVQAAHEKQAARDAERHAKAVRKAEKKGLPAPPPLAVSAPDLPPEPQPTPVLLVDHKLARKSAKNRRKMERKQGDLEVRLEKADAKRRAQMERRIAKLERKARGKDAPAAGADATR